jgi:hypothetical protein
MPQELQYVQLLQEHKQMNWRVGRAEDHTVRRTAADLLFLVPGHRG